MLYLQRSIVPDELVGREAVIGFKFTDLETMADWSLLAKPDASPGPIPVRRLLTCVNVSRALP